MLMCILCNIGGGPQFLLKRCGHHYHAKCFTGLYIKQCPLCRVFFSEEDKIRIYPNEFELNEVAEQVSNRVLMLYQGYRQQLIDAVTPLNDAAQLMIAATRVMISPVRETSAAMLNMAEKVDNACALLTHLNERFKGENKLILAIGPQVPNLMQMINQAEDVDHAAEGALIADVQNGWGQEAAANDGGYNAHGGGMQ